MTNLDSILKSRAITLPTKVCLVKAMVFPVVMNGGESWTIKKAEVKNWCFWTVVLEKTVESPLDCKEIQPVHPKGDQSWVFRKDWCWSWNSNTLATWCEELTHLKRPWCLKIEGRTRRGRQRMMVGWHHRLDGHEFEQALGVGDGQGSVAWCSPWSLLLLNALHNCTHFTR